MNKPRALPHGPSGETVMNDINNLTSLAGSALPRARLGAHPASADRAIANPPSEAQALTPKVGERQSAATAQPEPAPERPESLGRLQLVKAATELNEWLSGFNTALQFSVDDQYGEMVLKVIDKESKEVIRQIPPEQALALAKSLKELEAKGQALSLATHGHNLDSARRGLEGLLIQAKA
jgi:flagellar protein FlaG